MYFTGTENTVNPPQENSEKKLKKWQSVLLWGFVGFGISAVIAVAVTLAVIFRKFYGKYRILPSKYPL